MSIDKETEVNVKNRHGCLTAWLVYLLIADAGLILIDFYNFAMAHVYSKVEFFTKYPDLTTPKLHPFYWLIAMLDLPFIIALFKWHKWGFWGYCATTIAIVITNIIRGTNLFIGVFILVFDISMLFWVLHIGKKNKGWPQLE